MKTHYADRKTFHKMNMRAFSMLMKLEDACWHTYKNNLQKTYTLRINTFGWLFGETKFD